jgi:dipeptidyl aminopeptidase/acylaminoacyl peptidase
LKRKLLLPFGLALFLAQAQTTGQFALTIDNIMRGPGLVGYEPAQPHWSYDSEHIYFQWKQHTDKEAAPMDTYVANRDGSGLRKLTDAEVRQLPAANGETSKDKRFMVYASAGDLYVQDNTTGKIQQLTKTIEIEANPHFLPDGKRIWFTRGGNVYVMSLDSGMLVQMTDIRVPGAAATPAAPAGGRGGGRGQGQGTGGRGQGRGAGAEQSATSASQDYLKNEQKELLEIVRERTAAHDEAEAKRKAEPGQRKPFNLTGTQTVRDLQFSPDEKYVFAAVVEPGTAKPTVVPNFISDTGYVEDINGRSNVGDSQGTTRIAILNAESGDVTWLDHGQRKAPAAGTDGAATPARAPASQDRDVQLGMPVWSEDGSKAVIAGRAADFKDRWIFALDPATGKTRELVHDHDNAWIGGPGANSLGWMKNDREIYFQSERTGYSQLYAVAFDGGEARALTSGNWEVLNVRQSRDKSNFYLTASKDGPSDQFFYEMPAEGGTLTRITNEPGKHAATLSPDERSIADIYSYTNKPPELYVRENAPPSTPGVHPTSGKPIRVTTSPAPEFSQFKWLDVPIVMVTARDGVKVPARLFKPAGFKKGGPGVIFVHGSGYLQNVDHKWSTYYHEYMFDHILMERGFTVIDVDYRGSAGYGRDWRTAIYEHMGGKDLDDIVDAAKYLVAEQGVDAKKIGLWGGSYGGFITLMAMFTQPDVFAAGGALRPVSDWALYNHGYTAEILNTPQADAEAYRKSSPIFFAEGLKGALLICHGMVDTNVEFVDTVRLVQRLIELRKDNWSVAPYPVEDHGFREPTSWADEYKRILALFEKNLK